MITDEMLQKFRMMSLDEYILLSGNDESEGKRIFYTTFLIQTDYILNKIVESQLLGKELDKDYKDILEARAFARGQL